MALLLQEDQNRTKMQKRWCCRCYSAGCLCCGGGGRSLVPRRRRHHLLLVMLSLLLGTVYVFGMVSWSSLWTTTTSTTTVAKLNRIMTTTTAMKSGVWFWLYQVVITQPLQVVLIVT